MVLVSRQHRSVACPPGDSCFFPGDGSDSGFCLRSCETDEDCSTGALATVCRLGHCSPQQCSTRGGVEHGGCPLGAYCSAEVCEQYFDGDRPSGWAISGGWCFVAP